MSNNTNRPIDYAKLDKILQESQAGRGDVVWVSDPRHPDGGYYVLAGGDAGAGVGGGNADEIERYLRSN